MFNRNNHDAKIQVIIQAYYQVLKVDYYQIWINHVPVSDTVSNQFHSMVMEAFKQGYSRITSYLIILIIKSYTI